MRGISSIAVGFDGRVEPDLAACLGPYLVSLPLDYVRDDPPTFRAWVAQCAAAYHSARAQRFHVGREPTGVAEPFFPFHFRLREWCEAESVEAGFIKRVATWEVCDRSVLSLVCEPGIGGVHATLVYDSQRIEAPMARRLVDEFSLLINVGAKAPDAAIDDLIFWDQMEAARIWSEFNTKGEFVPLPEKTFLQLFEQTVWAHPENIAVQEREYRLTYREVALAEIPSLQRCGPSAPVSARPSS